VADGCVTLDADARSSIVVETWNTLEDTVFGLAGRRLNGGGACLDRRVFHLERVPPGPRRRRRSPQRRRCRCLVDEQVTASSQGLPVTGN